MRAVYEQDGIQAVVNNLGQESIAYLVISGELLSQESLDMLAAQFGNELSYNETTGDIAYAQVLCCEDNGNLKNPYAALQPFVLASERAGVAIPRLVKNFLQQHNLADETQQFAGRVTEEDIFSSIHGEPAFASARR